MDESTLASFRQYLESRLRGLLNGGSGPVLKSAVDDGFAEPMDSADMASRHIDHVLFNTISNRNKKAVQEIQSAIKRIDEGEFGTCWLCSSSIGIKRLRAQPTAMLCIRCQGTLENFRRRSF